MVGGPKSKTTRENLKMLWWWCEEGWAVGGGVRGVGSWWRCEGRSQIFISILYMFDLEFRPASVSAENFKRLFKHSKYSIAVGPAKQEII